MGIPCLSNIQRNCDSKDWWRRPTPEMEGGSPLLPRRRRRRRAGACCSFRAQARGRARCWFRVPGIVGCACLCISCVGLCVCAGARARGRGPAGWDSAHRVWQGGCACDSFCSNSSSRRARRGSGLIEIGGQYRGRGWLRIFTDGCGPLSCGAIV
jgi:hypothetical protein